MLLGGLLRYFRKNTTETYETALLYAAGICVASAVNVISLNQAIFGAFHVGAKIRVATCSVVYRKVMPKKIIDRLILGQYRISLNAIQSILCLSRVFFPLLDVVTSSYIFVKFICISQILVFRNIWRIIYLFQRQDKSSRACISKVTRFKQVFQQKLRKKYVCQAQCWKKEQSLKRLDKYLCNVLPTQDWILLCNL